MDSYRQLLDLVISLESDFAKFWEGDNNAAGTRARNILMDINKKTKEMRKKIQLKKNQGDSPV